MSNACLDKELLLQAFFDSELDAVHALDCEAHLKTCPGCAAELRRLGVVRDRLAIPHVKFRASAALRERIGAALDEAVAGERAPAQDNRPQEPVTALRRAAPWTMGAGLGALAATLVLTLAPLATSGGVEQQVIDGHVRSLLANHLTDVATSNRHTVKPWFNGKVDFAPPVVDLADQGFPMAGGRLDYLDNHAAAALVYRRRAHIINVFVLPGPAHDLAPIDRRARGYSLVRWSSGGLTFWAVSDIDLAELQQFRAAFLGRVSG